MHQVKTFAFSMGITAATMALSSQYVFAGTAPVPFTGSNSASASSWVGGAQAGYNWQRGSFVYGMETDISAANLKSEMNTVIPTSFFFSPTAITNAKIDWYGTLRGRLGAAQGPVLFYGTGGLAYGNVDLNSSVSANPLFLNSQASSVRTGWVLGGGMEYMWRPNWILNLGYQYVDLGTANLASSTSLAGGSLSQIANAHAQFHVVTAGLSWRFSPTDLVSQGAWEGMYAGGHAGGAWGNNTDANYSFTPGFVSDARLKRDITLVGRLDDGLGLYRYRYLWSDTVYVGVMAQEVALVHHDAVVKGADGYLRVDYSRLGLRLMTEPEWEALRARL